MDFKTILDWHCSGNSLNYNDLKLLENEYFLETEKLKKVKCAEVAPQHICKACLIPDNNYWITCLASVLDQLIPLNCDRSRNDELILLLVEYGLLIEE